MVGSLSDYDQVKAFYYFFLSFCCLAAGQERRAMMTSGGCAAPLQVVRADGTERWIGFIVCCRAAFTRTVMPNGQKSCDTRGVERSGGSEVMMTSQAS